MLEKMNKNRPIGFRRLLLDLDAWVHTPSVTTVGVGTGIAWLWMKRGNNLFHLNSDTTVDGARTFLVQFKAKPSLQVVRNDRGRINKIVVEGQSPIPGFYLYLDGSRTQPMTFDPYE